MMGRVSGLIILAEADSTYMVEFGLIVGLICLDRFG